MPPTIAIYAQGEMGAGVARRLTERGARVLTTLEGRSAASAKRAEEAGMEAADWAELGTADVFLSILPPGQAQQLAEQMLMLWDGAARVPLYVDCNAVSPTTVRTIAAQFETAQRPFVDAGIIGGPPRPGAEGPLFYACGPRAGDFAKLADHGLDVEILAEPIGAASALKMSYAGITKGMTAILSIMSLAAERHGAAAALKSELARSQPYFAQWGARQCPAMIPKAYRWVEEMRQIGMFQDDPVGNDLYEAIARFYERIAADVASGGEDAQSLRAFFRLPADKS